jgi:hypothetical protein
MLRATILVLAASGCIASNPIPTDNGPPVAILVPDLTPPAPFDMTPGGPTCGDSSHGPADMLPPSPYDLGPWGPNDLSPWGPYDLGPGGPYDLSPGGPTDLSPWPSGPDLGPSPTDLAPWWAPNDLTQP